MRNSWLTATASDLRLADVPYIQVEDPPPPDDDPFARLTAWQDGVVSRRQALRHMSAKVVERKLRTQRWRVAWPGVYVTHLGTLTTSQQRWVAVLAAGGDLPLLRGRSPACLAGLTALQATGLRRIESPAIFVLTGAHRRRTAPRGVIIHRTLDMPEHGDTRHVRPPATPVGRSVVDACQWARSDDEARLIVAASFQQGIVTLGHIERALEQNPGAKRARLVIRTAWDCDGGSHTLTELDLVGLCRRAGLPVPNRQVQRTDLNGRIRYLDAVYDEWRIVIEIDGLHHLYVEVMWDDADRQNALELAGFTVLRFGVLRRPRASRTGRGPDSAGPDHGRLATLVIDNLGETHPVEGV